MILSPDGHCRAFDATARGHGARRRRRASSCSSGWPTRSPTATPIHAVIKGSAINNDGADKVGYTAPSVDGQARGDRRGAGDRRRRRRRRSATSRRTAPAPPLGDPIEVAALTQAFRGRHGARGFCAIGSVKTNIGHLDAAAGVAGLIKTVARAGARRDPAEPALRDARTRRSTSRTARSSSTPRCGAWPADASAAPRRRQLLRHRRHQRPRRARGGAGAAAAVRPARAHGSCCRSRRGRRRALDARRPTAWREHLRAHPDAAAGRRRLHPAGRPHGLRPPPRRRGAADPPTRAAALVAVRRRERAISGAPARRRRPVAFLFPGQGAQHAGMGARALRDRAGLPRGGRPLRRASCAAPRPRPARRCSIRRRPDSDAAPTGA